MTTPPAGPPCDIHGGDIATASLMNLADWSTVRFCLQCGPHFLMTIAHSMLAATGHPDHAGTQARCKACTTVHQLLTGQAADNAAAAPPPEGGVPLEQGAAAAADDAGQAPADDAGQAPDVATAGPFGAARTRPAPAARGQAAAAALPKSTAARKGTRAS